MSQVVKPGSNTNLTEPDEYNLYLGFMIPIGAILLLCILCLFVISWQLIFPKCSRKYCPKFLQSGSNRSPRREVTTPGDARGHSGVRNGRRTSVTLFRTYSDVPPRYDSLTEQPPSYDSVFIIEEEAPPGDRNSRSSGIRTYVYDPARRVSIEIHDEDTIRVVEELLSRRNSSLRRSASDPPVYNRVIQLPDKYPTIQNV